MVPTLTVRDDRVVQDVVFGPGTVLHEGLEQYSLLSREHAHRSSDDECGTHRTRQIRQMRVFYNGPLTDLPEVVMTLCFTVLRVRREPGFLVKSVDTPSL